MYTCTDRHDFYHIHLQVGKIEKGGIRTCIVKNIIFKLLFNKNTYTVYIGSKTDENHFRLHFHINRRLQLFKVLSSTVPVSSLKLFDDILIVCSALVNLKSDLIRDTEEND
jgi:hypothetical protein